MAADLVQANFSGATPGSDLGSFTPAVGAGFIRHPAFTSNAAVATAASRFRAATSGADTVYFDRTATATADYSVRAKLTVTNLSGNDIAGPIVRCASNSDSFYTFVWINYTGLASGLAIFKHVNGSSAPVGSAVTSLNGSSVVPVTGATAVLEIAVSGTTITGSFNGTTALTVTDADVTAEGYGGLYLHQGTVTDDSGIQADEFAVNDPTASSSGTGTNTGTGTNPTPTNPGQIQVTSPGHWCSPLNWDDDGSGAKLANGVRAGATAIWSAHNGAEGRFMWATPVGSGNVATLRIDTSALVAGSVPAGSFPKIKYRINDGAAHVAQVQPGTNGAWALDVTGAGVAGAGTYTLRYVLMASSQAQSRWNPPSGLVAPANSVKVTGLTVDAGATPVAPAVLGRTLAVFGDSITEGVEASGTNNGDLASNDSTLTYARALAAALGAEVATVGFGGQGWECSGSGDVPPFTSAFGSYSAGRPRDFTPHVDIVVCAHGTNDGLNTKPDAAVTADAAAWLAAARAKFGPAAKVFLAVPPGGFKRAALEAGLAQYQATTPDKSAFLIDGGPALQAGLTGFVTGGTWAAPGDGVHPDAATHARIAATFGRAIEDALDSAAGATPPTPAGPLNPSGATFGQLQHGGLSGQLYALIKANPTLDPAVRFGLQAGRNGTLDQTYQGLASLVESYLRGDPIATADVTTRLGEYAQVFAGYAQAAAEVAALVAANPGTLVTLPPTPHALNPIFQRTFS